MQWRRWLRYACPSILIIDQARRRQKLCQRLPVRFDFCIRKIDEVEPRRKTFQCFGLINVSCLHLQRFHYSWSGLSETEDASKHKVGQQVHPVSVRCAAFYGIAG
jgi:hypothetical protein